MARLLIVLSLFAASPLHAEVYRYVNEDGVVTFTDQAPTPEAEPIEVEPVTVIETRRPEFTPPPATGGSDAEADLAQVTMVSPQPEQTFQGTGNSLVVQLAAPRPLQPGQKMQVLLDRVPQGAFASLAVKLDDIPRGTHTVTANIVSESGEILAGVGPVTFYMKQHSVQHNEGAFAFPNAVPPGR